MVRFTTTTSKPKTMHSDASIHNIHIDELVPTISKTILPMLQWCSLSALMRRIDPKVHTALRLPCKSSSSMELAASSPASPDIVALLQTAMDRAYNAGEHTSQGN